MNVGDIALGEVIWALGRGALYGLGFLVVMFAFGLVPSPLGVLALPASMLIGFATAAAGLAATTFMRSWQDLDLLFVVTLPLFLFSGTFFPIDHLSGAAADDRRALTALSRRGPRPRPDTGIVGISQLIDVIYLSVMGLFFIWVASRRLGKMLIK